MNKMDENMMCYINYCYPLECRKRPLTIIIFLYHYSSFMKLVKTQESKLLVTYLVHLIAYFKTIRKYQSFVSKFYMFYDTLFYLTVCGNHNIWICNHASEFWLYTKVKHNPKQCVQAILCESICCIICYLILWYVTIEITCICNHSSEVWLNSKVKHNYNTVFKESSVRGMK